MIFRELSKEERAEVEQWESEWRRARRVITDWIIGNLDIHRSLKEILGVHFNAPSVRMPIGGDITTRDRPYQCNEFANLCYAWAKQKGISWAESSEEETKKLGRELVESIIKDRDWDNNPHLRFHLAIALFPVFMYLYDGKEMPELHERCGVF
jgi:transposase